MSTCSFKIRVKIEIKEHLSVRLTLQTTEFTVYVAGCFFCRKYVSFRLYYNRQNLTFPRNLPWNVCKTRGKPTMNWFFVRLWIKFAVHRSAADPKPVKFVSELAIFPSGDQNNAKCANKQKKKKKREKRKISSLHDRIFAAGHRISFFPPGLNLLTHRVSRRFSRLLCGPHVLQMRCNKLKDGFYGQNPAYFPQIYL